MSQAASAEPSMEEILASIRRIISEEETQGADEPLELSQPLSEAEEERYDDGAHDDILVFETEPEPEPAPPAAPPRREAPVAPAAAPMADTIVSPPTISQAAHAMSRLAGSLRVADMPGQTLEGMVREMLKPMLREWLDAHLPAIVEARVEAELERIARLAR
ncbi:MAG: DUF2497 domain-containing protein [Hyphomonadaceae bacterium]|nr:DUF2497 domain-containing protein [Hyphomonadaceae bacterium]